MALFINIYTIQKDKTLYLKNTFSYHSYFNTGSQGIHCYVFEKQQTKNKTLREYC